MELLVAVTVTLLVLGAALSVAVPASGGFHTLPEHADVQQRLRSVVEELRAAVWATSAGAVPVGFGWSSAAWPAVLPCGWGVDPVSGASGPCARPDVLSVMLVPRPLRVLTARALATPTEAVPVLRPAGCEPGFAGCEFEAGDAVVLADGTGGVDAFEVAGTSADRTLLFHDAPLSALYRAGATVASGVVRTYYTREDPASGGLQLRRSEGRSDQPVLDHLAGFSVEYFGLAAAPAVYEDSDGRLRASYGPPPRTSADEGGTTEAEYLPSCAFSLADGRPVSTLAALAAQADGLAPVTLAMLADGPWCPDAHSPGRFDADLFRIRRIRAVVRVQAPAPWFRGQHPSAFARPGVARDAERLVPDVTVRVDLALRGVGR